jgi:hypothetical protein
MAPLRIVQVIAWKWLAEFVEHSNESAACKVVLHMRLERHCDTKSGDSKPSIER